MEQRGQKIEGSRYYRDFCIQCGEPIRVSESELRKGPSSCDDCTGSRKLKGAHTGLTPRQKLKLGSTQ